MTQHCKVSASSQKFEINRPHNNNAQLFLCAVFVIGTMGDSRERKQSRSCAVSQCCLAAGPQLTSLRNLPNMPTLCKLLPTRIALFTRNFSTFPGDPTLLLGSSTCSKFFTGLPPERGKGRSWVRNEVCFVLMP